MRCAPWCLTWKCDGPCTCGVVSGEPREVTARTQEATATAQITPDAVAERDRKDAERYRFIRAETILLSVAIEKWDGIGMCPVGTIGAWLDATTVEKCDEEIDKAMELSAVRTLTASPDPRINPDGRPTGQITPDVINPSPVAAVGDS